MSSFLNLILFSLLLLLIQSKERDIYHVITGESDVPYKKSMDPVYYVGVYEDKPKKIPSKFDIEIMTTDSGKRFTCLIPKDEGLIEQNNEINQQSTDDESLTPDEVEPQLEEQEEQMQEEEQQQEEDEEEFELEPEKTVEELIQEVDTPATRNRFIQELIVHSQQKQKQNERGSGRRKNRKANNNCFYSREGYWNYELCLYSRVTQFHGNKNNRNPNIKLGIYETFIDITKILMNDVSYKYYYLKQIYPMELFQNSDKYFINLLYKNGEAKRETLVSVICSKQYNDKSKDGIIKVSEPKVHYYHILIKYKAVCDYEYWLKREYNIFDADTDTDTDTNADGMDMDMDTPPDPATMAASGSSSSMQMLSDMKIDPNSDDVSLLLSPLYELTHKHNRCLTLKQGWWTVEFCYGKYIRQIHLEPKSHKNKKGQMVQSLTEMDIKQEHVIGKWNGVIDKDSFIIHKNDNDPSRTYASIIYNNGDNCDLSSLPRKTEIQFRCDLNTDRSELISEREDPSCEYIAQVVTPLLCKHPDFKIPTPPSYEIVCYPFNENEFVTANDNNNNDNDIQSASNMKQIADIQSEYNSILKIVTDVANQKYQQTINNDNDMDMDNNKNNENEKEIKQETKINDNEQKLEL